MTIAEAKQLRIVDYLASLGYHPQSVTSKQYWYLSPLRNERTPSFKVNDRLNEWYDFGAATGGDLVELGKHLYQTDSVSEVLAYIGKHENAIPIQRGADSGDNAPTRRSRHEGRARRTVAAPCAALVPSFPWNRRRHRPHVLPGGPL